MGLFGRQPGDSLGGRKWDNLSDTERKRLFYRDRAREQKQKDKEDRALAKTVKKAQKMDRQQKEWERKAKWLAARNKLEREKRARRQHSVLHQLARRI